jgi:hypothetical protein
LKKPYNNGGCNSINIFQFQHLWYFPSCWRSCMIQFVLVPVKPLDYVRTPMKNYKDGWWSVWTYLHLGVHNVAVELKHKMAACLCWGLLNKITTYHRHISTFIRNKRIFNLWDLVS